MPGDFHVGSVGLDREAIAFDLVADDGLRERPDDRELITEVSVKSFEPQAQGIEAAPAYSPVPEKVSTEQPPD